MLQSSYIALVTGGTGFIGSRLAQRLLNDGWRVRLLVRNVERLDVGLRGYAEVVEGDLTRPVTLQAAVDGVTHVFHCAANVHTWGSWDEYETVNVLGAENLVRAMIACPQPPRMVHVSTVDVYGFPDIPCDETCPADGGEFAYGRSKAMGERRVRALCEAHGLALTVMRPCNVIGPGSQFVARVGAELASGLMLSINGGKVHAGLVHVDNLVDDMIWAAISDVAVGQCYNVRDDNTVSWGIFLRDLKRAIKGHGVVLDLPFAVADVVAVGFERVYGWLAPASEPMLHRLLVRLFGKTCGHSAAKLYAARGAQLRLDYHAAMQSSVAWFLTWRRGAER